MTAETVLAIIGLSAGVGSFVGGWAVWWLRGRVPHSKRRLVRHIYKHVDETLGARKTENDRRTKLHARLAFWASPKLANLLAPRAQFAGGAALPSTRRRGHYVQVQLRAGKVGVGHLWDVEAVTLRWTSEASANGANFVEWLERGRPGTGGGLAQALGLKWNNHLFDVDEDFAHSTVVFRRTRAERVPERIDAHDDIGELVDDL